MTLADLTETQLEERAQQASERRLAYANATLYHEEGGVNPDEEFKGEELAGPFCGCDTCVVREVLAAAWPYMRELARREPDMAEFAGGTDGT